MSNRSRAPRPQPQPGGIMAALKAAAEKQQAQQDTEDEQAGIPEPSGMLPTPENQNLMAHSIEWHWAGEHFGLTACYDRDTQTYAVVPYVDKDAAPWTPEQAKEFGEALLAAWQYQYTWQQHVGEFLVTADGPTSMPEKAGETDGE